MECLNFANNKLKFVMTDKNKNALITGAGKELKAIAIALAKEGVNVILVLVRNLI
jgi:NAD(P)-dependent dehydrogenase (short-subunit alcohol dehydrogenase family)